MKHMTAINTALSLAAARAAFVQRAGAMHAGKRHRKCLIRTRVDGRKRAPQRGDLA